MWVSNSVSGFRKLLRASPSTSSELRGDVLPGRGHVPVGRQLHAHAVQGGKERVGVGDDLAHILQAAQVLIGIEIRGAGQRRLRGRTQQHRHAVVRHQQVEHVQNRLQECGRQLLRLVQHDDAAGDAVQLAAARGFGGKQRLEQLHIGGDDERRVPVLAGQAAARRFLLRVGFGLAVVFVIFKMIASSAGGRRWLDWLKLHTPPAGDLVRKIVLSRSLLALGTLLNGGVPLMVALDTAAEASGNQIIGSVYRFTKTSVESGSTIADAFKTSPEFPPLLVQMTSVGERTGELASLLLRVSEFYYKESDARIKGLTSIIEPVLIIFLGGVVIFIALAVLLPYFNMVNVVQ